MTKALFVAPHADDETLGCGGTILKLADQGFEIYWLLVTSMSKEGGFSESQIELRKSQIELVKKKYEFTDTYELGFIPSKLDIISKSNLIKDISDVLSTVRPEQVFIPFRNDAHSDHTAVFDAVVSSTKVFRSPFVKKILAYETLSETDFSLRPDQSMFKPNSFINIENQIEDKIEIMKLYESELGEFPFPRSIKAIRALSSLRGVQSGCNDAEAFMLLKEIN